MDDPDEIIKTLSMWLAIIVQAAGGQILIPSRDLEELDMQSVIEYVQTVEGILLTVKKRWILDAGNYDEPPPID